MYPNHPTAVDDLWHAAVNGRGEYFSAKDTKAFREGMQGALDKIAAQQGAASTVALNFTSSGVDGAMAYLPSFQSGSWIGRLHAHKIVNGSVDIAGGPVWEAEKLLPAWDKRNIFTWNGSKAVDFTWGSLTAAQKTALDNDSSILEYLKGNDAKERSKDGGKYRNREVKLGDIANSSPLYVKSTDWVYQNMKGVGADSYTKFVSDKATRTPMLYVGANDGMMHAFNAESGVETFAFVPNAVYPFLKSLSDPAYNHHYFVDGPIVEGDAYRESTGWRNIIVGSMGAGAKSVYAIDVTTPTNGTGKTATNALKAENILWEKDTTALPDLGYQLGKAAVVRLRNKKWGVIMGNGYESANYKSVLYIVDAFSGDLIKQIDAGTGTATAPNGLGTPALMYNDERELVAAYAGDLQGNLWKFDLSDEDPRNWKRAFSGKPLFVAKNGSAVQPIVMRPALAFHPLGGYMVAFATGKYFDVGDGATKDRQSAYGIWDRSDINNVPATEVVGGRGDLQVQILTADSRYGNVGGAILSKAQVDWDKQRGWYIDLTLGDGERGVGDAFVRDDSTVYITTLDPVKDPCLPGGVSRLMAFDVVSGGASDKKNFPEVTCELKASCEKPTNPKNPGDGDPGPSVITTGGTVANSSIFTKPAKPKCPDANNPECNCGQKGQPACKKCGDAGMPSCDVCLGSTRKVVINRLDGTTQEVTISPTCKPPLRAWHQVNVGY